MSTRDHLLSQHHRLAKALYTWLLLISLAGCSAYPQPTPTATEAMIAIATFSASPTATLVQSPTITPVPQPMQIGSLGSGVMSDVFRSPDGQLIAIGIGNVLHWYDSKTFTELGSLPLKVRGAEAIRFSPDSSLVGIEGDLTAQIVDLGGQKIVATISEPESFISDLSITPDNELPRRKRTGYRSAKIA